MPDRRTPKGSFDLVTDHEAALVNVDVELNREQRLNRVEQFLKMHLNEKMVKYPDEPEPKKSYFLGLPGDIQTEYFADVVLFCSLLTDNALIKDFEFFDGQTSGLEEDYEALKLHVIEAINDENETEGSKWLRKKHFLSKDRKWAHLYYINNEWGFNVSPDGLLELSIDRNDYDQRRLANEKKIAKTPDVELSDSSVQLGTEQRYSFTIFFSRLRKIFHGESEEQMMVKAKKIIKEMLGAGFDFKGGGDILVSRFKPLYKMIEAECYGGDEAKVEDLVAEWHEIEAKYRAFLDEDGF